MLRGFQTGLHEMCIKVTAGISVPGLSTKAGVSTSAECIDKAPARQLHTQTLERAKA